MKAVVNRILSFSSVDGPGNRSVIFFQGCNLDCKYCHNPETRTICEHCGTCIDHCPTKALVREEEKVRYLPEKCIHCDACIKACRRGSSPKAREMTPEEIFLAVKKQIPFIRGITVSGGECMLQAAVIKEVFVKAKEAGLSTLIDSNGMIPFWEQKELLSVTDGVMLDIKCFDSKEHQKITGENNHTVLENAAYLAKIGKLFEVRMVIVPELYDGKRSVRNIGKFLGKLPDYERIRMKLIAYRPMGVREEYSHFRTPLRNELEELEEILREMGFKQIISI